MPEPSAILEWWLPRIRTCLGHKIHAVLLYGSAALDDFCPRWSDVDVCVVLETPVSPEEGEAIGKIHGTAHKREGIIYFAMYHPAAALHQQKLRSTIEEDMRKIPQLLEEAQKLKEEKKTQQLAMF